MTKRESDYKLESDFQPLLYDELKRRLPGCFLYKLDPNQVQGIPDTLVLWRTYWAILETKRWSKASRQPNQPYYVEKFDNMSFSAFVEPDNMQEVLDDLQTAFGVER